MKLLNKRIIGLLLALAMICGMMPMTVFAAEETETNPWSSRSAVFVGDSITAGSGTAKIYYSFLEEALGFDSVTAMGVGGSCISAASDYGTGNQPLINRYQNIPSTDLIVIFMGTNDYGHETPLGSVGDTKDGTFYGALNTIVPALVAKHTSSKIVFVTPLHRYGFGTSKILGTQFTYDNIPNGVGATLGDYVNALKTVCANNGITVIDLYTECTLDPTDSAVRSIYIPDGLHPNAAGHELIAGIMESHIRGLEPAEQEPIEQTEMVYGNRFAPGNNQSCRASSHINYYLKAGTVITLKTPDVMQWACAKTNGEISSTNLGYFPDSQWTDKETAVVAEDGWVGFIFKYRDETKWFDLTKPLSDYITIEVPHTHEYASEITAPTCTEQGYTTYTCECGDSYVDDYLDATGHTYKNGICTGCGEEDYDGLDLNGLNVLCLGDSITAGQGLTTETRWTNVLASKYGWNLTNKSQGGISLSSYYYTANGKSDVSIAKKAEILKTMTTKPDVIIVWGGHNDTSYRYSPLGTWDDETTDSFKGALKYIAELADEYAPDATLFVLTPLWTTEAPSALKVPENTTDNNWMFVDAIYEGAEAYGWIPVNMDLCGITPFTKSGLLLDNIHPNEAGTEKIVAYLSAELASYSETSKKETIIFNASAVSMKPGESTTLKAVLSPRSGTGTMTFTWSSSDSSVATVDASGKITAVAPGTAVITATAPNGISADISVSVVCEHTYEPSVTAPTCTEQGYTTYTCECGDSYVADYVDATGHTYENGTCTVCGAEHPNLANYKGKVISILGDSISTFAGYIPIADGFNLQHRPRYPQSNLFSDVNLTWWMQTITALDAKLGINDSWAGSTVTNTITGNSGDLGEKAAMASLTRIQNLGANGTPDVILFYGGTNDIGRLLPLGSFDPATAPTEVDLTTTKWTTVADAYVDAIMRLQYHYPEAEILAMLPTYTTSYYTNAKLAQYNTVFSAICEHYGIPYIDLRDCGISTADLPDGIHPDANGMDYITEAVLDTLLDDMEMEAGEHIVHSVTHNLNGAESSLGYYKGVTHGKSFVTTITGENVTVSVTMGGADITDTAYANGVVTIAAVTGDLVITAQGRVKPIYEDHLQQLPENLCCSTNLWSSLVPENTYYTGSAWGNVSGNSVYSITIPVAAGDQIWATSFQKSGTNGGNRNGIRLTWFDENGVLESVSPDNVYAEFVASAFVTAPDGAVAANVVMWNGKESNEVYLLNRDHTYKNGICTGCGEAQPGPVITQQPESVEQEIGKKFAITVKAEGEGLTYQWYVKESGAKAFKVSSNKTSSYAYTMQTYMHNRQVYCVIIDANGNSVQTETATITRPPQALRIVEQPKDAQQEIGQKFSISPKVEGEGLTYQWYVKESGAKAFKVSSIKGSAYALTMQKYMIGRQVYCVITDKYGNSVTTDVATISLPPVELKILEQPSDVYASKGEKFSVSPKVQGDGLTYQWYYKEGYMKDFKPSSNKTSAYAYSMQTYMNNRQVYCVITDKYGNQVVTEVVTIHLEK